MEQSTTTNRKYKDSIFVDLFCNDIHGKENFLSLYNAIHDSDLKLEDTIIEPVKLEQTVYLGYTNDISMRINNKLIILCEHQSTINENMPFRFLLYIAKIYEQLSNVNDRFKKEMIYIPRPEFFVFYNGKQPLQSISYLKLSDAFLGEPLIKNQLDLKIPVFNLNKKIKLLKKCKVLNEYSKFVKIAEEEKSSGDKDWMKKALLRSQNSNILTEYFKRKASEVTNMWFAEYNYETDIAVQREEAMLLGEKQGIEKQKHEDEEIINRYASENAKLREQLERLQKAK